MLDAFYSLAIGADSISPTGRKNKKIKGLPGVTHSYFLPGNRSGRGEFVVDSVNSRLYEIGWEGPRYQQSSEHVLEFLTSWSIAGEKTRF